MMASCWSQRFSKQRDLLGKMPTPSPRNLNRS
jgi:hypothetical protein